MTTKKRTPLRCFPVDALLGGGLEPGIITEIYGDAGSGKTNLCLQLARNVAAAGRKSVFIDTEGLSMERLRQICDGEEEFGTVMKNLLVFSPKSLDEQAKMVANAIKIKEAGAIILDSANMYYRIEWYEDNDRTERLLINQLVQLQVAAREREMPVVITGQVYSSEDSVQPFAGRSMEHIVKTILRLEKTGLENRKATIIKHRSEAEGQSAVFRITSRGME